MRKGNGLVYATAFILCGSRDFEDGDVVWDACNLSPWSPNRRDVFRRGIVISGGARGVDSYADMVAKSFAYRLDVYPADWKNLGRSAGIVRNTQMLKALISHQVEGYDVGVVAVWKDRSRGTKDMIRQALASKIPVFIWPV